MAIEKITRDRVEFSKFQNNSQKKDIDKNINVIIDKINEVIERINFLQQNKADQLPEEYKNKFLYVNAEGNLEGRSFPTEDVEIATVQYLPDNFITGEMIEEKSITGINIADEAIGTEHLTNECIKTRHIGVGQITPEHLTRGFLLSGAKIRDNTIDGEALVNGSIGVQKLAPDVFQQQLFYTTNKTDFWIYNKKGDDEEIIDNCTPYLLSFSQTVPFHFKIYGFVTCRAEVETFLDNLSVGNHKIKIQVLNSSGEEKASTDNTPLFCWGEQTEINTYRFLIVLNMPARDDVFVNTDAITITIPTIFTKCSLYGEIIPNGGYVEEVN